MRLQAAFNAVLARRPACEDRRFCDDALDAAASAARNIAEGFGRYGDPEVARFVDIAYGSQLETQTNLLIAQGRGYLSSAEAERLLALCEETKATTLGVLRTLKRRIAAQGLKRQSRRGSVSRR